MSLNASLDHRPRLGAGFVEFHRKQLAVAAQHHEPARRVGIDQRASRGGNLRCRRAPVEIDDGHGGAGVLVPDQKEPIVGGHGRIAEIDHGIGPPGRKLDFRLQRQVGEVVDGDEVLALAPDAAAVDGLAHVELATGIGVIQRRELAGAQHALEAARLDVHQREARIDQAAEGEIVHHRVGLRVRHRQGDDVGNRFRGQFSLGDDRPREQQDKGGTFRDSSEFLHLKLPFRPTRPWLKTTNRLAVSYPAVHPSSHSKTPRK